MEVARSVVPIASSSAASNGTPARRRSPYLGQKENAVIDAGADDDRAQERGLRVDVADPQKCKCKGKGAAHRQRQRHQHQLAQPAEIDRHHAADERDHQQRGADDVALDGAEFIDRSRNRPGEALQLDSRRQRALDDAANPRQQRLRRRQVERVGRGTDEQDRQVAALGHE